MALRRLIFFVLTLIFGSLHAQSNWQADTQTVTRENLWGVAYSGTALIAVGEKGTILYSDYEGTAWQPRLSGTDAWLVGVGYGNNRWIVVGDRGTILVSDDNGDTWASRSSGTTTRLNNVIYGNGRWLAIGEQGAVLTSADGNTWTVRAVPETGFLRALALGQGFFLFGGANGVLYSTTDGATFTRVPVATTANIEAAAITSGRFFISGSEGLWATTTTLNGNNWLINIAPNHGTFRGLVARSPEDASIAGDVSALGFASGLWSSSYLRPTFLVTEMTLGRDEAIAVGFGGGIARSSSLYNVAIVPHGNVSAPSVTAASAVYGTEVRLVAAPTGTAANIAFQWQRDGADIPGATSSELVLPAIKPSATGSYGVRAQAGANTVRSATLALTVTPAGKPSAIDPDFNFALASAPALVRVQPDGKILALGLYTGVAGSTAYTLVRLNRNGSVDDTFRVNAAGSIDGVLVLPDGRLYVRGMTAVDGQAVPRLARLTATGALDRTFAPEAADEFGAFVLAPDGGLFAFSRQAGAVVRLTASGARDANFTALPAGYNAVAVDAQGRLLATAPNTAPPQLWVYPGTLHRFSATGVRDTSYERNLTNRTVGAFVGDQIYGYNSLYGRFGASRTYIRLAADGTTDASYASPPGTPYPEINLDWNSLYGPDGSLWDFRREGGTGQPMRARHYGPNGAPDPTQRLELPDTLTYAPLALAADGSILALRRAPYYAPAPSGPSLVRLRPSNSTRTRLGNLSVRSFVSSADSPLIAGFVTSGTGDTGALVRAIGPGLTTFGVNDAMPDPQLRIVANGTTTVTNDQWPATLAPRFVALGAFALPTGSKDAALETSIGAGDYSAVVTPASGTTSGTALVEVYESTENAPRRLINMSARGPVAPGRPLIVGFTIVGDSPMNVLVRGVGPTLGQLGVNGVIANPMLTLYRGDVTLYENDDWTRLNSSLPGSTAGTGAFPLASASSDAAMFVTLAPGSYTAVVEGVSGVTGTALAEIYEVP